MERKRHKTARFVCNITLASASEDILIHNVQCTAHCVRTFQDFFWDECVFNTDANKRRLKMRRSWQVPRATTRREIKRVARRPDTQRQRNLTNQIPNDFFCLK